jgi:hypothetical protein
MSTVQKIAVAFCWLAVTFLLLVGFSIAAHGSTSAPKHDNSFGAVISNDNPYTYMYGSLVSGAYVGTDKNIGLNIRFQPAHTFAMFTQELLFCGDVASEFKDMRGPLVVTYRTRALRTIEGIGCHTLVSVDKVESKGFPQ